MIPRSLIAADRRHHTCLRDAKEHCRPLQAVRQVQGNPLTHTAQKSERERVCVGPNVLIPLGSSITSYTINIYNGCASPERHRRLRQPPRSHDKHI